MTKKEFVELYAKNGGFTKKEAERAVNLFLASVEDTLVKGDNITFVGWENGKLKKELQEKLEILKLIRK